MPQQANWWFCQKCHAMFFADSGGGRCPAGDSHLPQGLEFLLPHDVGETRGTQKNCRFCRKCYTLILAGYDGGPCPKGDSHSPQMDGFLRSLLSETSSPVRGAHRMRADSLRSAG
jgi:hypothetical protein